MSLYFRNATIKIQADIRLEFWEIPIYNCHLSVKHL